ncbi:MAG: amidohydrolase family protein [Rhodobacteraceae bacterium]|nr:amidohydrolase family protein [Paracoccaceae bacterium]
MSKPLAPLIDSHLHIWTKDMPLTDTAWHAPPDAPLEQCLQQLDENGVMFAVIAGASIHGQYADYTRRALKQHRRLRATAVLSPRTDIRQMEQMKQEGFVGVRLMRSMHGDVPELDGDYRMYLRRVADLDWHVHLVDLPERTAQSIAVIEASGAKLVIDHMGHLEAEDGINNPGFKAILAAIERGNTWVKISGRFRFDPPCSADKYAKALLSVAGTERLLWGSDWPFAGFENSVTYRDTLEEFHHYVDDAKMRHEIDQTGLKLYFG